MTARRANRVPRAPASVKAVSPRALPSLLVGALLCAIGSGAARADEPPAVARTCLACHGEKPALGAPSIAGQGGNFIQWQLVFFRTARRHNPVMQGLAANLADNDIRALGAYFASLPVPHPAAVADSDPELTKTGEALSTQRHCTSCHGDDFLGQQAAPRLAHQPEAYLAKSLADYRSGARPSSGGAAMTEVAGGLSEEEMKAVAHYLAVLP